MDPAGGTIKISCTVLEEEGKIEAEDIKDAMKHRVQLKGAKRPRGSNKKPQLQWLDENVGTYYRNLVQHENYDFIIGHAPYMANGCLNLKNFYKDKQTFSKDNSFFHAFPKDENGDIYEEMLLDWLTEADIVFSIGKAVEDELVLHITSLDPENRPIHKTYLPTESPEEWDVVVVTETKARFPSLLCASYWNA